MIWGTENDGADVPQARRHNTRTGHGVFAETSTYVIICVIGMTLLGGGWHFYGGSCLSDKGTSEGGGPGQKGRRSWYCLRARLLHGTKRVF